MTPGHHHTIIISNFLNTLMKHYTAVLMSQKQSEEASVLFDQNFLLAICSERATTGTIRSMSFLEIHFISYVFLTKQDKQNTAFHVSQYFLILSPICRYNSARLHKELNNVHNKVYYNKHLVQTK